MPHDDILQFLALLLISCKHSIQKRVDYSPLNLCVCICISSVCLRCNFVRFLITHMHANWQASVFSVCVPMPLLRVLWQHIL